MEEEGVLEHDSKLAAQRLQRQVPDVQAVETDGSRLGIVETSDQVGGGGLPRPARSDQRDQLTGLRPERELPQGRPRPARIRERHPVEVDSPPDRGQRSGALAVAHVRRQVHVGEDALEERKRAHDVDVQSGQVADRTGEPPAQDRHHAHHHPHRGPATENQVATEEQQESRAEGHEDAAEHPEPALDHRLPDLQVAQLLVEPVEAQLLQALLGEGLDQQDARDAEHLLHVGGGLGQLLLHPLASPIVGPAQEAARDQDHRHQRQRGQGELPAERKHHHQGADRDHEPAYQPEDRVGDDVLDAAHVVVHPRQQVTGAAAGEEADRLLHQTAEELPSEVEHDALADGVGEEGLEHPDQPGADGRRDPGADDDGQLREAAGRAREVVDQRLGHQGRHQAQTGADADARQDDQRSAPVGHEVAEHAPEQPPGQDRLVLAPVDCHARTDAVALWQLNLPPRVHHLCRAGGGGQGPGEAHVHHHRASSGRTDATRGELSRLNQAQIDLTRSPGQREEPRDDMAT